MAVRISSSEAEYIQHLRTTEDALVLRSDVLNIAATACRKGWNHVLRFLNEDVQVLDYSDLSALLDECESYHYYCAWQIRVGLYEEEQAEQQARLLAEEQNVSEEQLFEDSLADAFYFEPTRVHSQSAAPAGSVEDPCVYVEQFSSREIEHCDEDPQ
jgi:hypothetical protein